MIHRALDAAGERLLGRFGIDERALARAMWEELDSIGRARALARGALGAGGLLAAEAAALGSATEPADTAAALALELAVARLLVSAGATAIGRARLTAALVRVRDGELAAAPPPDPSPLDREVHDALAALVALELGGAGARAAARVAVDFAALGALHPAADALVGHPQVAADLEALAGDRALAPDARDAALALAGELARRTSSAEYTAFLSRHLDRHPRLLDQLLERAREAEDWPRVLELARRGLTLREDRARYNALAAQALDRLGLSLP